MRETQDPANRRSPRGVKIILNAQRREACASRNCGREAVIREWRRRDNLTSAAGKAAGLKGWARAEGGRGGLHGIVDVGAWYARSDFSARVLEYLSLEASP